MLHPLAPDSSAASLSAYLSRQSLSATDNDQWGDIRLQAHTYLTTILPPLNYVTSVRAILFQGDTIMVVRDPVRAHILPGGRREANESLAETLCREVLEETCCEITSPWLLGLCHFRHLTDKPPDYRYPYPDFLHLISWAEVASHIPERRETNGYELSVEFQSIDSVKLRPLTHGEHILLDKALHECN